MGKIFGGSKSKSTSSNRAYEDVNQQINPLLSHAKTGADAYQRMLSGDTTGFDAFKEGTGFNFDLERGFDGINSNSASRRILKSGASAKALQSFGSNLQNTYANNYMDRLYNQANLGFNAASTLTNAGGTATQTSTSSPGLGGFIGGIGSAVAASDRRLKKNIVKVGTHKTGLTLYQYDYINDTGPHIGVMADEVERELPEALGPVVGGYMTVDYGVLANAV